MRIWLAALVWVCTACGAPADELEHSPEDNGSVATATEALTAAPFVISGAGNNLTAVAVHGDYAAIAVNEVISIYRRYWFFSYFWVKVAEFAEPSTPAAAVSTFGSALDLWQDRLIVTTTASAGSRVEIYERQTDASWPLQATFGPGTGSNSNEQASYGTSPKLEGSFAVWGQSYANAKRGRVFIARRGSDGEWTQWQVIEGPGANSHQYFGTDIVLQNQLIAVGAPSQYEPGHVYVYSNAFTSFVLEIDLADPSADAEARFGRRLGFDNTNLVVRSDSHHYVYRRTLSQNWWQPFPSPKWSAATTWDIAAPVGELSTYLGKTAVGTATGVDVYDMVIGAPTLSAHFNAPGGIQGYGAKLDLHDDKLIVGGTSGGVAFIH